MLVRGLVTNRPRRVTKVRFANGMALAEAQNMASQVNIATMKQLAQKINGGLVPAKGLLEK